MKKNKAFLIETMGKDASLTMNQMIDEEIALNVTGLNGDNNKSKCDKSKPKDSWEWKYNSSARNLVRMWWLTKFLTKLLDNVMNHEEMTLVANCKDAYQTGFAEHHPWLVRTGAGLAMNAAGQKASLFTKWGITHKDEVGPCLTHFIALRDQLSNLLDQRSLKALP